MCHKDWQLTAHQPRRNLVIVLGISAGGGGGGKWELMLQGEVEATMEVRAGAVDGWGCRSW